MKAADLLFINLNKATSYAIELFREELRGQGHRSSGRLEESFAKIIEIKVNEAKGIITAEKYGIYLDKGVAANRVKYPVDVLFPWIRRIKPGISVKEMTSLAYAIRAVHKKKGIPVPKAYSSNGRVKTYSKNGRVKAWVENGIKGKEDELNSIINLAAYLDLLVKEQIGQYFKGYINTNWEHLL